jgi:hypothetical protein
MKTILTNTIFLLFSFISFGKQLISGEYSFGLRFAYDEQSSMVTGYFENYTSWDEETESPRFSCIFYLEGVVEENKAKIISYYPGTIGGDTIKGTLKIINNKTISIQLSEEHGGCWNVQHFVDEPVKFQSEDSIPWFQIRFIDAPKAYFYSTKSTGNRQKAYVIKNDKVYVIKQDKNWALCVFYGKKTTKGWIKVSDLNRL